MNRPCHESGEGEKYAWKMEEVTMEQMLAARQRSLRRGSEQQSRDLTRQMFSVPELTQGELVALAGYSMKESLCLAEGAGDAL